MDLIQCYATTNDSNDQDEEEFYSRLLTIIQDRPERNVIIVMSDFNAKIGSDNRSYEEIMGQMNDNGERQICPPICYKQPNHRREFLPTPKDTQSDLGITRSADRESY